MRPISRVRVVLAERRLSLADLSDLTGIPYPRIRRICRREGNPFLDDALAVARALEVPLAALFRLDEHPGSSRW